MKKLLQNLSFEEWIRYIFDHPVKKRAGYWNIKADYWDSTATVTQVESIQNAAARHYAVFYHKTGQST